MKDMLARVFDFIQAHVTGEGLALFINEVFLLHSQYKCKLVDTSLKPTYSEQYAIDSATDVGRITLINVLESTNNGIKIFTTTSLDSDQEPRMYEVFSLDQLQSALDELLKGK